MHEVASCFAEQIYHIHKLEQTNQVENENFVKDILLCDYS